MITFLGLTLFLLPSYLIRLHIFGLPTTVLELLILAFLFASLFKITEQDLKKVKSLGIINWAAGLFILSGIIATIVSPEKIKALGELKAFIIEPILLFYAVHLVFKKADDYKILLRWLFASATLISLFGLIQYVTFIHLPLRFWGTGAEVERITSVFDYPNALALYLAPLFGLFTTLWLKKYRLFEKVWIMPIALAIQGVAIVLTFSRGAWVAIVVVLILLFFKKYSWKHTWVPILLVFLLLLSNPVYQRIKLGLNDASSSAHFQLLKIGTQKVLDSPFIGTGLHGFSAEGVMYPHNIFLNFWLELGLLGLIAFALTIFAASEQHRKNPTTLGLAASVFILVFILHGLVDVPYFKNDLSVLFWFVIAMFYIPDLSHKA